MTGWAVNLKDRIAHPHLGEALTEMRKNEALSRSEFEAVQEFRFCTQTYWFSAKKKKKKVIPLFVILKFFNRTFFIFFFTI